MATSKHPNATVESLLTDLEDCIYWPYVEGVLPILADALEEAGDERANMVRTAQLTRTGRTIVRWGDGIKGCDWQLWSGPNIYCCSFYLLSEQEAAASAVQTILTWLRSGKKRPIAQPHRLYQRSKE